jgi:predicted amidohydrolase YtcJ
VSGATGAVSLIILNGQVFDAGPGARALAASGDRIVAVGSQDEIRRLAGPTTQVLDAAGGLILPGFNDAHLHLRTGAHQLRNVDLSAETTVDGMLKLIAEFAGRHPEREWISGRGWRYEVFPGGFPTRQQLDRVLPDRPAAVNAYDEHTTWVNSAALARLGVTRDHSDPPGGQIMHDADGEPSGILKETAMRLVDAALPAPTGEAERELLREAMALANRHGITSVQDAGSSPEDFAVYEDLARRNELNLRLRLALRIDPGSSLPNPTHSRPIHGGILKFFLDGVVESRTAFMLDPYEGSNATGKPRWDEREFAAVVKEADRCGWQIEAHAIGDGAVRMALDAFDGAAQANGPRDRRHRIEHIEIIHPADLPRFGRLGVIASFQPYHADPTPSALDIWVRQIGTDRASRGWVWRSIQAAGGRLAFGSDWPVVSLDPRLGLNMAVNRTTPDGHPSGGWLPGERLPINEALRIYTAGSAFAEFAEREKGVIRPGMLADLTILDRDPLTRSLEDILQVNVMATIVGGRVVYRQDG